MAIKVWSLFEKFKLSELNNNFAELANRTSNINNTADINKDVRSAEELRNFFTTTTRPTSANLPIVGDGSLKEFKATSLMTEGKPPQDAHVLHFEWDNANGFSAQLAIGIIEPSIYVRGMSGGVLGDWETVYTSSLDGSETPTATNLGTITIHTAMVKSGMGRYKLNALSGTWTANRNYAVCTLSSIYRPTIAVDKKIIIRVDGSTEVVANFYIGTDGNVVIKPHTAITSSTIQIDETYMI